MYAVIPVPGALHIIYSVYTNLDDSVAITPETLHLLDEVKDARMDCNGNSYPSLGEAIRRMDKFLEAAPKIPFVSTRSTANSEGGSGSTMSITGVLNGETPVGIDIDLNYQNAEAQAYHIIRSALRLPLTEFDEKYLSKRIAIQVWASREIDVLWGYGYLDVYRAANIVREWQHLHAGYNEFILDTGTEEFAALERPETISSFYINYLFGSFDNHPEPEYGEYTFRMSYYCVEDVMKGLLVMPSTPGAGFAGSAGYALTAGEAENAKNAEHAVKADEANLANVCVSLGAVPAIQSYASGAGMGTTKPVFNKETGIVDVTVNSETIQKSDYGFSIYLGQLNDLRGKKLIFYLNEKEPLDYVALNVGYSWGHPTYQNIKQRLTKYTDQYWVGDFDDLFEYVVDFLKLDLEDFNGEIYIMFFCNVSWTLPEEGDEYHNYYSIYAATADGLIFNRQMEALMEKVNTLSSLLGDDAEALNAFTDLKADVKGMKEGTIVVPKASHAGSSDTAAHAFTSTRLGIQPAIQKLGSLGGEMKDLTTLSEEILMP